MNTKFWKPLALGLSVMLLAAPLWAQESSTQTTEEPAAETSEQPETDPPLNMGEVVGAGREPGSTYVDEVFGDWERKCIYNPDSDDPCQLYQLLRDESGQATAEITILHLPEGGQAAAGATIVVPLQTLLTQQLTISIDGGQTKRYPFRFCTQVGCFSQIGLTADEVAAFKRGANATITIVPAGAPDQKVQLPVSLTGFTAGFDSLAPTAE